MKIILNLPINLNPQKMYDELAEKREDSTDLIDCVHKTTDSLLSQEKGEDGMNKPVCLLGKIQSGKTRAFIGVIADAFDRGVNCVIVLTKNSTLLGKQTTRRLLQEFQSIESGKNVIVNYITDIDDKVRLGISEIQQKRIIVGIKHFSNIEKIYKYVVEKNPELAKQKILIIDDEADVSTIGYRLVKGEKNTKGKNKKKEEFIDDVIYSESDDYEVDNNSEDDAISEKEDNIQLLKVAENISLLRKKLKEHYFLQVTATPASIFLQPEVISIKNYGKDYSIEEETHPPLLSDKTIILPIHKDYIGGEYFFLEAESNETMAQFSYREILGDEIEKLTKKDNRHIKNIFKSNNFPKLVEFINNVILTAACNIASIISRQKEYLDLFSDSPISILNACKDKIEGYSAMIHLSTEKNPQKYQTDLVESYLNICKEIIENKHEDITILKERVQAYFTSSILPAYEYFKKEEKYQNTYLNNLSEIDFELIFECFKAIIRYEHIRCFTINSDFPIESRIDPISGELRREVLANIYIGGQSLDRGITIQNMVGFFYGREPKVAQLDTTLQHARIYGNRKAEDLIFTRLYSSEDVFTRLKEITSIDLALRESIINNDGDNRFATIELGRKGKIKPTNPNRLMISNCINIKEYKRFLPVGFQTRKGDACEKHMQKIDSLLSRLTGQGQQIKEFNKIKGELFFITWGDFKEIFNHFKNGMIDTVKWGDSPMSHFWDIELLEAFYTIIKNSYFAEDEKIILMVKRNRKQSRVKIDGRFQDAPDTAQSDSVEMKEIMKKYPVPGLFLFEQDGKEDYREGKNYGWEGQRFYWPLLMLPQFKRNIMISIDPFLNGKDVEL
jgi:hypothetical protein